MPKPARGPHLTYRPGLDGIRALAVAGVFLYHAKPYGSGGPWLVGGFLGVDLFFVLSGYLITSILLVEWEHHRRIDLLRFWQRRARRLFPAVVVVVLASLLLSAIFARDHLSETRSDTFSSLFYFNNWHQIFAKSSYFDQGYPSLLRHYQTLGLYNFAVARADLPDDLVYSVVRAVFENHEEMMEAHAAAAATVAANIDRNSFLPVHPGAIRYYRQIGKAGQTD